MIIQGLKFKTTQELSVSTAQKMYTNYHILTIKYIGPSNYNGSRIKIISERFKESRTIGYDHEFNNALEGAENWLENHGFNIIGHGEGRDHMYVITDTFISPKSQIKINPILKKRMIELAKKDSKAVRMDPNSCA